MPLTEIQIREILKTPRNRDIVRISNLHESRLQLHCATTIDQNSTSKALNEFLAVVKKKLPEDKFKTFLHLIRFPLPTLQLTESIFSVLYKLFEGRNPVFQYYFSTTELEKDWLEFKAQHLPFSFWENEAWEKAKTGINSLIIVDLKQSQSTLYPEPYFYFRSLENTLSFDFETENETHVIFRVNETKIAVYDDNSYRIFSTPKNENEIQSLEVNNVHGLGYCPANFFWETPISYENPSLKKSPITVQLSALDDLLEDIINTKYLKLYAKYPIMYVFASDGCDFVEKMHIGDNEFEDRYSCDGGFLVDNDGYYIIRNNKIAECPKCSQKRLNGAGSVIEVEPPSESNEKIDLRDPVGIIEAPVSTLEYNDKDVKDQALSIYSNATGFLGSMITDHAVNEEQVKATLETWEMALKTPQKNFEKAIEWVHKTIITLRYPRGSFSGCKISLGTEHYLLNPSKLMDLYKQGKELGFSFNALDLLENRYYALEYRNNPKALQRQQMINHIDPLRHYTAQQAINFFDKGLISADWLAMKINLSSLIMQFERENVSILDFGILLSLDQRVKRIRESLITYASLMMPEVEQHEEEIL